jgi:two-component system chemotaxis response regulator CheY
MIRIDFNRLRFLAIDNNAHMRRILRTLLHGFGSRDVYEAEDGAAGLEAFTNFVRDIVITDCAMPIFDGLELTHMIRQPGAKSNPYVGVIMLTGHSEKKRMTDARDAAATEFLVKPISAKGLYQRIVNVVTNSRPLIKTKTYFGTDRRRNVNPNYVGPGLRKGGKADVIRQTPMLEKVRSPSEERNASHGSMQRYRGNRNLRRSRADNAGEQAAQCGFLATAGPGRRGSDLARRSTPLMISKARLRPLVSLPWPRPPTARAG